GPRRKLTTILCADCAGYSRMMGADEEGTYRALHASRELITRLVGGHEGRIFGSAGDRLTAEFPSPVEAGRAGAELPQGCRGRGGGKWSGLSRSWGRVVRKTAICNSASASISAM